MFCEGMAFPVPIPPIIRLTPYYYYPRSRTMRLVLRYRFDCKWWDSKEPDPAFSSSRSPRDVREHP
jgi:hypothetical protein